MGFRMSFTHVFRPRIRRFGLGDPRIDSIQRRPKKEDQGAIRIRPGRIQTGEAEEILDSGFKWTLEDFAEGIVHPFFRQWR